MNTVASIATFRRFHIIGSLMALSVVGLAASHAARASDIVDTAVAAGSFNTLVAAAKAAGLVDALKGPGPLTVFAPTDEAFAKLPAGTVDEFLKPENKEKLKALLLYHVVSGKVMSSDLKGVVTPTTQIGRAHV